MSDEIKISIGSVDPAIRLSVNVASRSEPIAIAAEKEECALCREVTTVLEIDASNWEYPGTAFCSSCLRKLADELDKIKTLAARGL